MFTCPAPAANQSRQQQQKILWTSLALHDTPPSIIDAIKFGILQAERESPDKILDSIDPLTLDAFCEQTQLGWEAFLRGRISLKWQIAYSEGNRQFTSSQSLKWAGHLVGLLLQYSQQFCTFRCGVVHGHNSDENKQHHKALFLLQVQAAYDEYHKDPFHVPSDWRRLFTRPVQSFHLSDRDTLACWLQSYSEAVQQQALMVLKLQEQLKNFFQPRPALPSVAFSSTLQEHLVSSSASGVASDSDENTDSMSDDSSILDYIPFDPGIHVGLN